MQDFDHHLAVDLKTYLTGFKNAAYGLRFLAKESGLNQKTLKRLLNKENKPTYQTLIKLYSVILETQDYQLLLKKVPEPVREYLKEYAPEKSVIAPKKSSRLLELLQTDGIYIELFVAAGIAPLRIRDLSLNYGKIGMDAAANFEAENIFIRTNDSSYSLSPSVTNLDGEILKILGVYFLKKYSQPREVMGENSVAFYAEGLNQEGLKEWLKIDSRAFYEKLQIANNPKFKGSTPVFTVVATDTLNKKDMLTKENK